LYSLDKIYIHVLVYLFSRLPPKSLGLSLMLSCETRADEEKVAEAVEVAAQLGVYLLLVD
jgi:hypothetical protein